MSEAFTLPAVTVRPGWSVLVTPDSRLRGGVFLFSQSLIEIVAISAITVGPQMRPFAGDEIVRWAAIAAFMPVLAGTVIALGPWITRRRLQGCSDGVTRAWAIYGAGVASFRDGRRDLSTLVKVGVGCLTIAASQVRIDSRLISSSSVAFGLHEIARIEVVRPLRWMGCGPLLHLELVDGRWTEIGLRSGTVADMFGGRVRDVVRAAEDIRTLALGTA